MWLREEGGTKAFFPDVNFLFGHDVGSTIPNLIVEGSPAQGQSQVSSIVTSPPVPGPSSCPRPFFSSGRCMHSVNVKVVQARMKKSQSGKAEFTCLNQMFVNVARLSIYLTTFRKQTINIPL